MFYKSTMYFMEEINLSIGYKTNKFYLKYAELNFSKQVMVRSDSSKHCFYISFQTIYLHKSY